MKAKLDTDAGKARYKKTQTDRRTGLRHHQERDGFTRFRLRGLQKAATEWLLVALAYNCRRLHNLRQA